MISRRKRCALAAVIQVVLGEIIDNDPAEGIRHPLTIAELPCGRSAGIGGAQSCSVVRIATGALGK
jgi:hypothetical protein